MVQHGGQLRNGPRQPAVGVARSPGPAQVGVLPGVVRVVVQLDPFAR